MGVGSAPPPDLFSEGPKAAPHRTKKVAGGPTGIGSHPLPDFISRWGKTRTNLPPERGENNELCPITTGKKRARQMDRFGAVEIHGERRTMTDKAKKILRKLKLTKLFRDPQGRDQILRDFNASTLDPVGPLGGEKGEQFLKELNEMQDRESEAGQNGKPDR